MNRKYRVALVGAGVIAQEHLRALKGMDGMNVVAVCDTNGEKAGRTASEWGIKNHYTDFLEMLQEEDPSIVSILTPPQAHAKLASEAVKLGVNCLVEKPFTLTTADAKLILDALRGNKAKLTLVYHYLYSRVVQEALRIVEAKALGEVLSTAVSLLGGPEDDLMGSNPNHWSHGILGGRIAEMLPHPVYLLQAFLGDDLQTDCVYAEKRGERSWMPKDELQVSLHGMKGMGHIYVSYNAPRVAEFVDVYGTERILRIDLTNQTLVTLGHRTLSKIDSGRDPLRMAGQLILSTGRNAFHFLRSARGEYALQFAYGSLVDSIETDEPPMITSQMAYKTVDIVEQISKMI